MNSIRRWFVAVTVAVVIMPVGTGVAQNGETRTRRATTPAPAPAKPGGAPAARNLPAQDNDPIQLSTDVVNVFFSVTDQKNRFIGDIAEQDIVLTEAGEPQQIFSFGKQTNLPLEVAIVIDMSSSQEFTFSDEKRAAQAFLQSVVKPRKDTAAIVTFGEDVQWVQGMTNRLERVNESFNRLSWQSRVASGSRTGATALYDAVGITATELFPKRVNQAANDTATRRAIIVLTDGDDTASDRTLSQSIDDALRSEVIVYVIGIGDRYRSTAVKRAVLDTLADQTGGHAYFPTSYDDLRAAFRQIDEEMRSQYLIAYEPTNTTRDGSFRVIEVEVPARQDVKIFHRKGYFAPRENGAAVSPTSPRP
ncbi:MAG TPA: VWA domain-containing protein [Blastocatellia bacterium]|nr:VWA domain-containing protein [Blastocatellia bacterium]